jgi:hypothetical protein
MPGFAQDIRPLFRAKDVQEMRCAFDLSRYDEVKANAQGIYDRLADGSIRAASASPWLVTLTRVDRRSVGGWTRATRPRCSSASTRSVTLSTFAICVVAVQRRPVGDW